MAILPSKNLIRAIRQYKAGDQAAFGDIYHESLAYVTKCVLTVLNRTAPDASEDLKQDILQDTYLTIATKLDTLQSEEAFLQWAGQIATNHALRTWEKDLRRQDREQPTEELIDELPDERFIPEDILYDREKQQLIRKMLQELPTNQYLCLVEYFYNGLKETEVAQKLDMPLGTVKTNLSRAKKKLKDIIQTHEKKSGVKLYSMSWLLLLLWKDLFVGALTPAQAETTLRVVVSQLPKAAETAAAAGASAAVGSTAAAASGAVSGTATGAAAGAATGAATASGSAAASGAAVAAKAAVPLAAKIAAGILAAATVVGSVVAAVSPKEDPYEGPGPMPGDLITLYYQDHYYNLVGPFEDWDQVLDYQEEYGGYPITVNSAEENLVLTELMGGCDHYEDHEVCTSHWPIYTGLYWDSKSDEWRWVNGDDVTYTYWAAQPEEPTGSGHFGAYSRTRWNSVWEMGTLGENQDTSYYVAWEYEADSTLEQRKGPFGKYPHPENAVENIFDLVTREPIYQDISHLYSDDALIPGPIADPLYYNGHYYVLSGPFISWNNVWRYLRSPDTYPATITDSEENDAVWRYIADFQQDVYFGLIRDGFDMPWLWSGPDELSYTNWAPDLEIEYTAGMLAAYFKALQGPLWYAAEPEREIFWVVLEYETLPYFLEDTSFSETIPCTEATEATEPATQEIVLRDEELARMEQILTYVAYVDSGSVNPYVGQTQEEWLAHQKELEQRFQKLRQPVEDNWDKCSILLLMGWNEDPALEGGPMSGFYGDFTGMAWCYPADNAERIITQLFGSFDISWLDGNVVSRGYTTEISDGILYQPITHLYGDSYGTMHIQYIEDLGDDTVAIHAVYEHKDTVHCVYTAKRNPDSIIGYQLTGVTYTLQ